MTAVTACRKCAAIATVRCRRGTGNKRFYDGIKLKEGV